MPWPVIAVICRRRRTREVGAKGARGRGDAGSCHTWYMLATMFTTRESEHAALRGQRPPDKHPDLPYCNAIDLRVPQNYREAVNSEFSELWEDSVDREFCDLFDA